MSEALGTRRGNRHPVAATIAIAAVAAASLGAYEVKGAVESNAACALKAAQGHKLGAIMCATGLGDIKGVAGTKTPSRITNIDLKSQGFKNKTLDLTFGVMEMNMGGAATFNYNKMVHIPGLPPYNSMTYNKGNKKTTEVIAAPCVTLGNYKSALETQDLDGGPVTSQVHIDATMAPNGRSISSIVINAGRLDYCLPHVAQTQANQNLWGEGHITFGQFGYLEGDYYVHMMDTLLTTKAMAQACPENGLSMSVVKQDIATAVKGSIGTTVAQQDLVTRAYAAGLVTVKLEDALVRQKHYEALYEQEVYNYEHQIGAPKNTRLEPVHFDNTIALRSCDSQSITVHHQQ